MRPSSKSEILVVRVSSQDAPAAHPEPKEAGGSSSGSDPVIEVAEKDPSPWERAMTRVGDLNTLIKFGGSCVMFAGVIFGSLQFGGPTQKADSTGEAEERRLLAADEADNSSELGRDSGSLPQPGVTTTSVTADVPTETAAPTTTPTGPTTTAAPATTTPPSTTVAPTASTPSTMVVPSTISSPVTAAPSTPSVPTGLRETNQGIDASGRPFITLAWSKAAGVSIVQIERDGLIVRDDDNLAFRDVPNPALTVGQQVTYRIRAVVDGQASQWSDPITVTVV